MRVGAEGAAAVRDYLAVRRELFERDRHGAVDVARVELLRRAYVDEDDVVATQPPKEVVTGDRLDFVAQVIARRSLHLGQPPRRRVAQLEPELHDVLTRERVVDPCTVALASYDARGMEGQEVLGGVRGRLAASSRQFLDATRTLSEQVDQLQATWACERLAHHCDRLEQRILRVRRTHGFAIQANY